MRRDIVLFGTIVVLVCGFGTAGAAIWYVHPDSTLNSIQAGLDSCSTNDTVLVGAGIYYESLIWPNTQGIDLVSELGPDTTIVDGSGTGNVVTIASEVDSSTVIGSLTIRNGSSTQGAGIWCHFSSPTITGNTVTGNVASGAGGGIHCDSFSSGIIDSNTVSGNTAMWGGGIYCYDNSSPAITRNFITGNTAHQLDGGIGCYLNSSPTILWNEVYGNTAQYAGGIGAHWSSSPTIKENLISGNTADGGGGIDCYNSSPVISKNTITGNTAPIGAGIDCWHFSSPFIDSCTISSNNGDGITCGDGGSSPEIHHCDITDNTGYGVQNLDSSITLNAQCNWWGDLAGPGGEGPGTGDGVSKWVDYEPWLGASPYQEYLCGDCNGDGNITFADALYLKNYYYQTPPGFCVPIGQGDVNLDGNVTFGDALYIKNYYYQTPPGSPPPCEPPKTAPYREKRMKR